jgi:serine protease Do
MSSRPAYPDRRHALPALSLVLCLLSLLVPAPANPLAAEGTGSVDLTTAITRVARQTIPAVVHIEITERVEAEEPSLPFGGDFFRRFFGAPGTPRKFRREVRGLGTGVIMNPKGYILTNHHVAGGATKVEVQLSDGRRFAAKLVGTDPKTDLAVIRIESKEPFPAVRFGDSDKVEVGEWVVAIGHPRGLDQTVTQGIISAKHRRGITDPSSIQDFLQTDAAINPGNSGGPLLNLRGEVIGINAAIASESGGSEGIGFTIPSNIALFVSKALIEHGKVERGWLGVSVKELTPEEVRSLRLETARGAQIADVVPGSPAQKAGLMKNDVVVAFRGKPVDDPGALQNEVAQTPVGQETRMTIVRGGKRMEVSARMGSPKEAARALSAAAAARIGGEVRPLTDKEAAKYGLEKGQGVAVTRVDKGGPLDKAGFEKEDIIIAVEGQAVGSVEAFTGMVGSMPARRKTTLIAMDHRSGRAGQVQITTR